MIGQTISHYKILEKLGEGGMGVVYKAQDTKLNRQVALKFLTQRKETTKEESTRLLQEARAAARLNHPNIAMIFDFDEVEDPDTHSAHTFIAMEYVEGKSLKSLIQQGPLSVYSTRSITIQLAQALSAAHSKGIIHRDLKPANVIVMADGIVKILDFGVAKLLGETTISKSGDIVGTIAYMSPEQIQGAPIDARSDIWSLGITIFEMLTQRLPFSGEHTPALMYSITNAEPVHLHELRPAGGLTNSRIRPRRPRAGENMHVSSLLARRKICPSRAYAGNIDHLDSCSVRLPTRETRSKKIENRCSSLPRSIVP